MINRDGRGRQYRGREVKFLDPPETNHCESIRQGRFH